MMAAKSDGVLKLKRSDVAFTPLQNSEHCGSAQGLLGQQTDSVCTLDVDFPNGESQCCGRGGSKSPCFRLSREQQKYVIWDCLWIVAAVSVYLADVGTDVWLSVDYYLRQDYWWFGLTLFFVVLGSFSVQLFSFRWFVADFSTEDNVESAVGCPQLDGGKLLLSGSASQQQPDTPQRQMNTVTNGTGGTGGTATGRGATQRSPYYSVCVWLCQSIIHILQLGQIWRHENGQPSTARPQTTVPRRSYGVHQDEEKLTNTARQSVESSRDLQNGGPRTDMRTNRLHRMGVTFVSIRLFRNALMSMMRTEMQLCLHPRSTACHPPM